MNIGTSRSFTEWVEGFVLNLQCTALDVHFVDVVVIVLLLLFLLDIATAKDTEQVFANCMNTTGSNGVDSAYM